MNCPLCNSELEPKMCDIYPNFPSYKCERESAPEESHYHKYFSADWSYARYEERATLGFYRVVNYYNHHPYKFVKDFGAVQKYMIRTNRLGMQMNPTFQTLLRFEHTLKIPPEEQFSSKINTYLLFS